VEDRPRTPSALEPDASSATVAGPDGDLSGDSKTDGGGVDRTPQTHEEWTAFAALPAAERAVVYLRSLPMALALLGAPVVFGALAFIGG
jgi:hypothetical protein